MTAQPCPTCPHLQAALAQAEADITRLQLEVSMLMRIISAARGECVALVNEANEPMPTGVARGIWAHAKGMREGKGEAALRVLRRLEN
jgi:hypothetical protein